MHLYQFFNPFGIGSDKYVIIEAATNVEALNAYVSRYFPHCYGVNLSKDFHRDNAIQMKVSLKKLNDGRVIFCNLFAIDIN